MMRAWKLNVGDRSNRRVTKPRELLERDEQLACANKKQNPWADTFVTSAGEVLRPSAADGIDVLLDSTRRIVGLTRPE